MTGELQPLDQQFPIVDGQGQPTLYFIRWAQQRQIDIVDSITLQDLQDYLTAHKLVAGNGIGLAPDGDINNSPTISAKVQEILDQITNVRGSILYRGNATWTALAPGTAGYLLSTNGAGADPSWIAPPSGSTPWYWSPPTAASFTLSNGGGATNMVLTDDTDCGLIIEPNTFAGPAVLSHAFALVTLASSTANWTLTARFEGSCNGEFEYNGFGLCLYESGTGKFIEFDYQRTYGQLPSIAVDYWNSASSFNSDQRIMHSTKHPWLRVVHAGGNYTFQISACGKRWITILVAGDTAFLAGRADKVGFTMGCARATDIYWQYTCQNFSVA
jgi:hypothetical protein